jgi:hypothetical protein
VKVLDLPVATACPSLHDRIRELARTPQGCVHLTHWCGRFTNEEAAYHANVLLFKRVAFLPPIPAHFPYGSVEWRVERRRRFQQVEAEVLVLLETAR